MMGIKANKTALMIASVCGIAAVLVLPCPAQQPNPMRNASGPMAGVFWDQKLSKPAALDAAFTDETGKEVKIGDYLGDKPAILNLIFYKCPGVCSAELDGMVELFKFINLVPGKDFQVVTVSINPMESPGLAAEKKTSYMNMLRSPEAAEGWHFLVGSHDQIHKLADSVGYGFTEDLKKQRFAHPAGIILLTPKGMISRYFLTTKYNPKDVRLALVEASDNRIGSLVDRFVLTTCLYQYDPITGKYGLMVFRLLQIGGFATVLSLAAFMFVNIRREKRSAALPQPVSRADDPS